MNELTVRNKVRVNRGQHRPAREFASTQEAKEFLIDWIVAEARGLGVPVSDVERKMLYASKNGWTLPDMDEVQDAFDRYHEAVEYELKMTNLIRMVRIDAAAARPEELRDWDEAVRVLGGDEHYLLQLIAAAEGPRRRRPSRWRLWLTAVVIFGAAIAIAYWIARH
jgi:hypothetical protein